MGYLFKAIYLVDPKWSHSIQHIPSGSAFDRALFPHIWAAKRHMTCNHWKSIGQVVGKGTRESLMDADGTIKLLRTQLMDLSESGLVRKFAATSPSLRPIRSGNLTKFTRAEMWVGF